MQEIVTSDTQEISIKERENINISGVKKIVSFDDEVFLLETTYGPLEIKGSNLEIIKLDTFQGIILIKGVINSLAYLVEEGKKEKGMLSKLFKWRLKNK